MRVYLDVCCLNRPFDDQSQDRIHLESEAVVLILKHIRSGDWEWISSEVVDFEVAQTPDVDKRHQVEALIQYADKKVRIGPSVITRASNLEAMGFSAYDALHLACAEHAKVDVLLTTDDNLVRLADESSGLLDVRVGNPLTWLKEVI